MASQKAVLCLALFGLCHIVYAQRDHWNPHLDALRRQVQNGQTTTPEPANPRIIGGPPITNHCMAPFNSMVALQVDAETPSRKLTYCTGTLISADTVVTAALCLLPFVDFAPDVVKVIVGDRELMFQDSGEQMMSIAGFTIHPLFNPVNGDNNIAVVKLRTPAVLGPCVQPMERYTAEPNSCQSALMNCRIAGWGAYTVTTAVNNSQPARYGDIRLFDDVMTQVVYNAKYLAGTTGPTPTVPPLPSNSLIAEAFEGSNIAACIYDWGSMVACSTGGVYKLRGVVANANCDIGSLFGGGTTQIPLYVTKLEAYRPWLDVCLSNYGACATSA